MFASCFCNIYANIIHNALLICFWAIYIENYMFFFYKYVILNTWLLIMWNSNFDKQILHCDVVEMNAYHAPIYE